MNIDDIYKNRCQTSILWVYDITMNQKKEICRFPYVIEAPNWHPDGETLFYNSLGSIYRLNLNNPVPEKIDTGEADSCNNDHVLSADGTAIAVSSGYHGSLSSRIFVVSLLDGSVRKVMDTDPSYLHGWSHDGKTIAYCAARQAGAPEAEWDVYSADLETGEETRLTWSYGLNDGPEFAPDDSVIWFNSVRSGRMQVWKMNLDGSQQTQMTFDRTMNAWFPHISPDNKHVVYVAYHQEDLNPGQHVPDKHVEIRMISSQGGEETTLVRLFGGQGTMNVNSWSPDSTRFAFVSYE